VTGETPAGPTSARVLTLNLWGWGQDWPERRRRLAAGLAWLRPDLITFQEAIRTDDLDEVGLLIGDEYQVAHQTSRGDDGVGVTTASRWPLGAVMEIDLPVTPRTEDFACTTLVTEILAPEPLGRIWLANHLPSWEPDFEHERCRQAVVAARELERLADARPGHIVVAGDFDAEPEATSVRFWTGQHPLEGWSVCYRDAWESAAAAGEPGETFSRANPYCADWDWPFRRIDYVLVRCGRHGGPTLTVRDCRRVFDSPDDVVSDHYGVLADLGLPPAG
jgi:endonuclease/exonuclease/phosphatase family metal-dependent hydrolase